VRAHLEEVLERRRKAGLLGGAILGNKAFSFRTSKSAWAGAYICGEESALIESLEGKRGEARNRMPFRCSPVFGIADGGQQCRDFAWVPCIWKKDRSGSRRGGLEKSPGARLFSVSGAASAGIYEYPSAFRSASFLKDVGAENAKAVPSPRRQRRLRSAAQFDRKLAFEDLATGGSIIVFGNERDMFAVAENFQHFFAEESCGSASRAASANVRLHEAIGRMRQKRPRRERPSRLCGSWLRPCRRRRMRPRQFQSERVSFILDSFARRTSGGQGIDVMTTKRSPSL